MRRQHYKNVLILTSSRGENIWRQARLSRPRGREVWDSIRQKFEIKLLDVNEGQ
jgi:hypothetical protein